MNKFQNNLIDLIEKQTVLNNVKLFIQIFKKKKKIKQMCNFSAFRSGRQMKSISEFSCKGKNSSTAWIVV